MVYSRTTDAYRYYIEQMRDWYAEGLIYPDFFSQTSWFDMIQGPKTGESIYTG